MTHPSESDGDCDAVDRCAVCQEWMERTNLTRVKTITSRDKQHSVTLSQTEFRCYYHENSIRCLSCDAYFDINLLPPEDADRGLHPPMACPLHQSSNPLRRLRNGVGIPREQSGDQLMADT